MADERLRQYQRRPQSDPRGSASATKSSLKCFFFTRASIAAGGRAVRDNAQTVWLSNKGEYSTPICRDTWIS